MSSTSQKDRSIEDELSGIGKERLREHLEIQGDNNSHKNVIMRIFNSNVTSVLLYGCETWRMTEKTVTKLQTFINRCLRRVLRIYWPSTISNFNLWEATGQAPVKQQIMSRKWTWIGRTLRRPIDCIAWQALWWNPQGSRRRGRPRNSWRRDTERTIQL